jgi:hypothetical protein
MARTVGAIATLALLVAPATASASGTLDQRQEGTKGGTDSFGATIAQTFTAGLTGKLSEVELFVSGPGSLEVQIRNVQATGEPGTEVLASQTLAASSSAEWNRTVFSSPAQVASETQYAIVVYGSPGTNMFGWNGEGSNPYARGAGWSNSVGPPVGTWVSAPFELDYAFKTYVQQLPTSKEQCKKGGWKNFGTTFKNQGQCVSFVEAEKHA